MKCIDPGHQYELNNIDGEQKQLLIFVKRMGDHYPNNYSAHEGVTSQEVLRVLIDRAKYLNSQISCAETDAIIQGLRQQLYLFELRAKRVKKKTLNLDTFYSIEYCPTCITCGHILCSENHPHER